MPWVRNSWPRLISLQPKATEIVSTEDSLSQRKWHNRQRGKTCLQQLSQGLPDSSATQKRLKQLWARLRVRRSGRDTALSLWRCLRAPIELSLGMPTICDKKDTTASSVFQPAALLREARRQKGLTTVDVPAVCILDSDGDIVRRLRQDSRSLPFDAWPCYHTRLDTFSLAGRTVGIVGCAVGDRKST